MIATYASILHEERAVTFEHDECIYRIAESMQEEGWHVDRLKEDMDSVWYVDDGGLCTGNAKDAVEFMLPREPKHIESDKGVKLDGGLS